MKQYLIYIITATIFAFVACKQNANNSVDKEENEEQAGMKMLEKARNQLGKSDTEAARNTIMDLRKQYPLAIEARKQAILTLDSIELAAAKLENDTLKVQFYQQKIIFDKKELNTKK